MAEPADLLEQYSSEQPRQQTNTTEPQPEQQTTVSTADRTAINRLCQSIGSKLSNVSTTRCLAIDFNAPRFFSNR